MIKSIKLCCCSIVFLSIFTLVNSAMEIILSKLQNNEMQDHLNCLNLLLGDYNLEFTTLVYDHLHSYDPLIFKLNTNKQVMRLSTNQIVHFDDRERIDRAILIVHNLTILEDFLIKWYNTKHFNENCKMFIVYHGTEHPNDVIRLTSQVFMYRVIVIDQLKNIYVPQPRSEKNCNVTTMEKLPKCDEKALKYITQLGSGTVMNYHTCPVVVLTREYSPYIINVNDEHNPGLEITMLKEFSNILNFTIHYHQHDFIMFGTVFDNGTYTYLYKALKEGVGNILIGIAHLEQKGDFSQSKLYMYTDYRIYIPKSKEMPRWVNLIYVFTPVTWCAFITSTCLFQIFYYLFQRLLIRITNSNSFNYQRRIEPISHSFFDIFGVTIAQSVTQPQITLKRILFVSWALVAFIFSSGYENKLLSFLLKCIHEKQIKTYEDIVKSNLDITGGDFAKEAFSSEHGGPYEAEIYRRWSPANISDVFGVINNLAINRDCILVANRLRLAYFVRGTHLRHYIYDAGPVINFYSHMLLQKGHPLLSGLNTMISRYEESGFFDENIEYTVHLRHIPSITASSVIALRIDHVLGAFVIYILGICVSLIMLFVECLQFLEIVSITSYI